MPRRGTKGSRARSNIRTEIFQAYANVAWGHQYATVVASNQYLFTDPVEYAYIATHYIPTDHDQTWTGSAGASYLWNGTRFSTDMIFGSGLRSGFANLGTVPAYTQVNVGLSHEFKWSPNEKPLTVRFDVVNLFDSSTRSGTAAASASSRRNMDRGEDSIWGFRRRCDLSRPRHQATG